MGSHSQSPMHHPAAHGAPNLMHRAPTTSLSDSSGREEGDSVAQNKFSDSALEQRRQSHQTRQIYHPPSYVHHPSQSEAKPQMYRAGLSQVGDANSASTSPSFSNSSSLPQNSLPPSQSGLDLRDDLQARPPLEHSSNGVNGFVPSNPRHTHSAHQSPTLQTSRQHESDHQQLQSEDFHNGAFQPGQSQSLPPVPHKARSVMACVLCRKQKMKCEGPDSAPCRRCKVAGVECTFESPPITVPRARVPHTDSWLESRMSNLEERLSGVENLNPSAQVSRIPPDYERRIAQLEGQVYALQLAISNISASQPSPQTAPQPQAQVQSQPPQMQVQPANGTGSMLPLPLQSGGHSLYHLHTPEHILQQAQNQYPSQYPQYTNPNVPYRAPSVQPNPSRSSYDGTQPGMRPDNEQRVSDNGGVSIKRELSRPPYDDQVNNRNNHHRDKRIRSEPSVGRDFIARGLVTEEEALMCYESYFLTFAIPAAGASGLRTIHIPFAAARARCPLLVATLVSIGARTLSRYDTYQKTYHEAMLLSHQTFLPDKGRPPTQLDLKAIILLSLYNALPELCHHGVALAHHFNMPLAFQEFERLDEEDKSGRRGRLLISKGRTFLVAYLWTSLYTYCRGKQGYFNIPSDVVQHQLRILEQSVHTQQPTDRVLLVSLEECFILKKIYEQLGPGVRKSPASYEEVSGVVTTTLLELEEWSKKWVGIMELMSHWGDHRDIKTVIPLDHGRLCTMMYVFQDMVVDDQSRALPNLQYFSNVASRAALTMLRWAVESRVWLPNSMVANYLDYVNIPNAIVILDKCTRLFPENAPFSVIRPLLYQISRQCHQIISLSTSTSREVTRATKTRDLVVDFDRFAFEGYGNTSTGAAINAMSMSAGMGGMPPGQDLETVHSPTMRSRRDPFGADISGNLGAMVEELNRFGVILLDALEESDDEET